MAYSYFEDYAVGDTFESRRTYQVTAEEIKSYASKWDPHPFHLDEAHAKTTLVGQLFAPSMLTLSIATKLTHDTDYYDISIVAGLGIDQIRMLKPVLAGDQLQVRVTIASKRDSKSKPRLGIITTKHEVIDQHGEAVLSYLLSGLVDKRPQDSTR